MHIKSFYIDRTPVTNAEFKKFLTPQITIPADDHNFLRNWSNGTYPEGWANKPVRGSPSKTPALTRNGPASAFRTIGNGNTRRKAPSATSIPGATIGTPNALPPPDHGRTMRAPTDVDAFAKGASPFGVLDMEGNISQWTDEFRDEHTRAAIIRGGAYYQPRGSPLVFPANLSPRRTPEIPAHVSRPRSLRHNRLPLCCRRPVAPAGTPALLAA